MAIEVIGFGTGRRWRRRITALTKVFVPVDAVRRAVLGRRGISRQTAQMMRHVAAAVDRHVDVATRHVVNVRVAARWLEAGQTRLAQSVVGKSASALHPATARIAAVAERRAQAVQVLVKGRRDAIRRSSKVPQAAAAIRVEGRTHRATGMIADAA